MINVSQFSPQDLSLKQVVMRRRYLLLAVLSWVVMVILLFSVVIPQFQEITYARTRMESEQKNLDQMSNKLQFLRTFDQQGFAQQNTRLNTILPSAKPFLTLLYSLKQLSSEQGVIFSGLDWSVGLVASDSAVPQAQVKTSGSSSRAVVAMGDEMQKMGLELKVLGTTGRLNSYFDAMTKIAPAVEIDSVTLTPKSQIQPDLYEATLKLSAYYAPLTSLRGTVTGDKPLPQLSTGENEYIQSLNQYKVYTENPDDTSASATPSAQRENPFAL